MKRTLLAVAFLLLASISQAQTQVTVSWTLSTDDTAANCIAPSICFQSVYRADGACSSSTVFGMQFAILPATATSYVDTAVRPGQTFCYSVTFTRNGSESALSNTISATVPVPSAPTALH